MIESLVGTPPVNDTKTKITLENVMEKLDCIITNLPNNDKVSEIDKKILDNTTKFNVSLRNTNRRINMLETKKGKDDQTLRIEKLEEVIDTLGNTFSSLNPKAIASKKGHHVPKVSKTGRSPFDIWESEKVFRKFALESCSDPLDTPGCNFEELPYAFNATLDNT